MTVTEIFQNPICVSEFYSSGRLSVCLVSFGPCTPCIFSCMCDSCEYYLLVS